MKMKKILVTGSSGTIGTRLSEKLLDGGFDVVGLDCRPNKWVEKVNEITVVGNALDGKSFDKIPTDFDLVIHLAANARVYNLVVDPRKAMENIQTLFNTLEFCRKNSIKRFIFASSREVYGNSERIEHSEDDAFVKNCESPYTASKIGGEALVHAYNQCYGMDFIIVRFSNVYGMYDESDRVVPIFIKLTKENKDLEIYGKEKLLDFTYIDDAVAGVMKCVEKFGEVKNDVFNIGSGKAYSIEEIARMIREYMKGKNEILMKDTRVGEVEKFIADTTKARSKLGHSSKTMIEEGIQKSIEWYTKVLRSGK